MKKIACVVVTYNKLNMLKQCLEALANQTRKIDVIHIIDNCSTDETSQFVQEYKSHQTNISYHRLERNLGGAGGFNQGIKDVMALGADYIWIMDDDTIPQKDSLQLFLSKTDLTSINWGFFCSDARWIDGHACLMNIPHISLDWTEQLTHHLVKVNSASFVSLFTKKEVIKKVGLPITDFFIWGDDVEFTQRITKHFNGYLMIGNQVTHKMKFNHPTDIVSENESRIKRYYFEFRNRMYIAKRQGKKSIIRTVLHNINILLKIFLRSPNKRGKRLILVLHGMLDGIFFNPKIEMIGKIHHTE